MTKFLRYTLLLLAVLAVGFNAAARIPGSKVGVSFDKTEVDFGNVSESVGSVHVEYVMTNTSDGAVAILSARASCGCTKPKYPKKPVMPGDTAVIQVDFATTGQRGEINKEVTLRLRNASGKGEKLQLVLRGVVLPD